MVLEEIHHFEESKRLTIAVVQLKQSAWTSWENTRDGTITWSLNNCFLIKAAYDILPTPVAQFFEMYLIMLSVKQGGIKYHFLSLWHDSVGIRCRSRAKLCCCLISDSILKLFYFTPCCLVEVTL